MQSNKYGDYYMTNPTQFALCSKMEGFFCRAIRVVWSPFFFQEYPLVEHYDYQYAMAKVDNDTSFFVTGSTDEIGETHSYYPMLQQMKS